MKIDLLESNQHTGSTPHYTELQSANISRTTTDDLTRDLTVLSFDFAVKITSDFHAKRRPQYQCNLLQI